MTFCLVPKAVLDSLICDGDGGRGYVESMDEAFEKWLGDGRPCNVERPKPSLAEASALVQLVESLRSLILDIMGGLRRVIQHLKVSGVDAIEAFHRSFR